MAYGRGDSCSPDSKDVYLEVDEGFRMKTIILIDTNFNNAFIFPQQNKKNYKPKKVGLDIEIKRRKTSDFAITSLRSYPQKMEWLVSHPVTNDKDKDFIILKVSEFIDIYKKAKEEEVSQTRDHWKGIQPHLRLIHCITDFSEIKEAFLMGFNVMSKQELVGRKTMISEKWNDEKFNLKSTLYPDLYDDFSVEINIGKQLECQW